MEREMMDKDNKNYREIIKKLDGLLLLGTIEDISLEDKSKILKYSVGLKPAARILKKDPSNFKKSLKKYDKKTTKKRE